MSQSDLFEKRDPWAEMAKELLQWPADLVSEWEERAAILEYDAGLPREEAERKAWEMVRGKRK